MRPKFGNPTYPVTVADIFEQTYGIRVTRGVRYFVIDIPGNGLPFSARFDN